MKTVTIDIEKFIPLFQQCRITAKTHDALYRIENRTENMEMLIRIDGTEHRTLFKVFEALALPKTTSTGALNRTGRNMKPAPATEKKTSTGKKKSKFFYLYDTTFCCDFIVNNYYL